MKSFLANVTNDKYAKFWLAGYALIVILPFIGGVNLFDWDEVNFAEAAREMIATGNYAMVQINYEFFWEKPPMFIWLQSISFKLFGVNAFAARLVNAVVGLITILTIFRIGQQLHSKKFGLWWAALFLLSITPHFYLQTGLIDPLFNLFIFGSIVLLFHGERSGGYRYFAFSGVLLGLAILTKGPVAGLIVGLVGIAYVVRNKEATTFRVAQLIAFALPTLVVASIWMILVVRSSGIGLLYSFFQYQFELLTESVATHGQPWYYHFVVLLLGVFPASLLAINRFKNADTKGFEEWMKILFWVVLILFSIVTTKIVHYSSLCFFPLTYLATRFITDKEDNKSRRIGFKVLWFAVLGLLCFALVAVPLFGVFVAHKPVFFDNYIQNAFVKDVIHVSSDWSFFDVGLGTLTGVLFFIQGVQLLKSSEITWILGALPLVMSIYMYQMTNRIDQQLQEPIIEFYDQLRDENCYVETYKFKSYAQYFYTQIKPYQDTDKLVLKRQEILDMLGASASTDLSAYERVVYTVKQRQWFIKGHIDKPVYLVCLNTYAHELDAEETMKFYGAFGPYRVYKRMP